MVKLENVSSKSSLDAQTNAREQTAKPEITTKTVTETQPIPFSVSTENSNTLEKGQTRIATNGVDGVKTLTYNVTYTDGIQTSKELVSEEVTTAPVTQVALVGAYVAPVASAAKCDPNYSGCVPNVYPSDVDCAGGKGNGPYYASGPVQVLGIDRYDLDRNNDGVACE